MDPHASVQYVTTTKVSLFLGCQRTEWDSDMASLLALLALLTPQSAERKQPKKINVGEATYLLKFHKSCQSLDDNLLTTEGKPSAIAS
ncbi:hypothetical protein QQF64_001132 [Cirrhinus molitorella]|uniref:Uncharacterized protein n=1 Tax=Cirrhinus molitorella TaxID=172907 RepID=A0ABR3NZ62_9TELE